MNLSVLQMALTCLRVITGEQIMDNIFSIKLIEYMNSLTLLKCYVKTFV